MLYVTDLRPVTHNLALYFVFNHEKDASKWIPVRSVGNGKSLIIDHSNVRSAFPSDREYR